MSTIDAADAMAGFLLKYAEVEFMGMDTGYIICNRRNNRQPMYFTVVEYLISRQGHLSLPGKVVDRMILVDGFPTDTLQIPGAGGTGYADFTLACKVKWLDRQPEEEIDWHSLKPATINVPGFKPLGERITQAQAAALLIRDLKNREVMPILSYSRTLYECVQEPVTDDFAYVLQFEDESTLTIIGWVGGENTPQIAATSAVTVQPLLA